MFSFLLSFLAGALIAFSPCVLPALPIIMGSAAQGHRFGPALLIAGMITSFTGLGVFLGGFGQAMGIGGDQFRMGSAVLLVFFGLLLFLERPLGWLTHLSSLSSRVLSSRRSESPLYHFLVGALLGGVWSPCVGPILGSAITLSSQKASIPQAGLMMFFFSLGTGSVLLLASTGIMSVLKRNQVVLAKVVGHSKKAFAIILIGIGILTLGGFDKQLETLILNALPQRWIELTSSL